MSDLAEPIPGIVPGRRANATAGYLFCAGAATLFAINGTVSKSILIGEIDASRLSQLRVTAAFLILLVVVAITRPAALRIKRSEIGVLLAYGILGVAMTQFLYFVALERLPVGVALLIEFTAPIMVALWFRFGMRQQVNRLVWLGLAIALTGLALVGQVWQGLAFDGLGVIAAFGAAAALATYFTLGDRQVRPPYNRDAVSLTMWGFGGAALFWVFAAPWWSFPWGEFASTGSPLGEGGASVPLWTLALWMIVLGTAVPFWLEVKALQNIRASQASVVAMLEPLLAIVVAWIALSETLTAAQIVGAFVVLTGVYLAERSR
jgi:drug/metabolite transporter (DMT)-like permease